MADNWRSLLEILLPAMPGHSKQENFVSVRTSVDDSKHVRRSGNASALVSKTPRPETSRDPGESATL